MPVIYDKYFGRTRLLLWSITETKQELSCLVLDSDLLSAERFASSKRQLEHLASRAALRSVISDGTVEYAAAGAPYISGTDLHISISHTDSICAVSVSSERCAVDIEYRGRNFAKAANRYISGTERETAEALGEDGYGIIWCAKEALYKYSGQKELNFTQDIRITEVFSGNGIVQNILSGAVGNKIIDEIKVIKEAEHIIVLI